MERDSKLDLLKTISMLGVLWIHYGYFYFVDSTDMSVKGIVRIVLRLLSCTAVPLFFMINGALLLNRDLSDQAILYKAKNILVKLMVFIPFTVILYPLIREKRLLSPREILNRCWNWNGNGVQHLWFLFSLLTIYLLYPFINKVFKMYDCKIKYFYYGLLFLFTFGNSAINLVLNIISYFSGNGADIIYTDTNFFYGPNFLYGWHSWTIVYFVTGAMIYKKSFGKRSVALSFISVGFMSALYIWVCRIMSLYTGNRHYYLYLGGYNQFILFFLVLALYVLTTKITIPVKVRKVLGVTGSNTLGILFFHRIYGEIFTKFFDNFGIDIAANGVVWGLGGVTLIYLCSLITTILLKKCKLGKILL